jgi:ATP-dependent exoDNAse (exonuclease V) beta subunit
VSDQYQDEKTRTLVENLNLLYVAFTRPIQRLYILAKSEKNWKQSQQVSTWLHDFLSRPDSEIPFDETQSTFVLSQGNQDCFHAHSKSNSGSYIIRDVISNDRTDTLRLRRMAERIFDVETFERKKDQLQKMRHLLIKMNLVSDLSQTVSQLVREGIVVKEEAKVLFDQVIDLFKNESLQSLYSEDVDVQINKELLLPGGKMLHVDRIVQLPDKSHVFMTFVAGSGNEVPKRHLELLVKVFENEGKSAKAILITLENEIIEWIA